MFHIASFLSILFLCPRIEWSGHIVYAPGSNDRGILFSSCLFVCCLSVCLSVVNFNLRYNIWTVRDRDFIFGMHTPLMMPFEMTPRSMTLWFDFDLEAKNSTLLPPGGHTVVFHNHPLDFLYARQTGRMMVWWCLSRSPSVRLFVRLGLRLPVFRTFLLHALTFCTWLCFNVLRIKFECRHFASIFEGVMPLCELRI